MKPLLYILVFVDLALASCSDCAYRGCHFINDSKLNIHLVAHTHDDAGWLKTADQYFYGGNKAHAEGGVQYIIDSVLGELDANENRRFILAETLFLWRWWNERSDTVRTKMKMLVQSGRLQLVNGGWVMSDEATPHYSMLIDQMSLGIRYLKSIFGDCGTPKIAWQIDPFGHSSEMGAELVAMAYDAVFFGRINHDEYITRRDRREMEMIWKPFQDGNSIFAGVLYNLYQPPDGFCFDVSCKDEPIIDNPRMHGYNVEWKVRDFVMKARTWAEAYQTNHVILTMGGDFHFMVASSWFVNLDKIISYVNRRYDDVNIIYSTPACYIKALNNLNVTWPTKTNEDFFPYSSYEKKFWTGYYTSRPTLKYMIARVNNLLQVVKKMGAFSSTWNSAEEFEIERAVALAQHHDAISGTQKQHVASDYALYLHEAVMNAADVITRAYRSWGELSESKHSFCMLRNISECHVIERSRKFVLFIFNPLSRYTNMTVRLPFGFNSLQVYGFMGQQEKGDVMPIPSPVLAIPGRHSTARHEYVFQANDIPPMGYLTFYVQQTHYPFNVNTNNSYSFTEHNSSSSATDVTLGFNSGIQIIMNSTSGLLQYIVVDDAVWYLEQNFGYYEGAKNDWYASGAYTFKPSSKGIISFPMTPTFTVFRGKSVIEVHQVFDPSVSQVIRLYEGQQAIEFEWLVGPITVGESIAKEVVVTYRTLLETGGIFYTDSNGRRFMKRKRDGSNRAERNYHPVTSAAMIKDDRATLTVLTDRAQGASSMSDGSLEFMIHRRLLLDDGKGVVEPLDEKAHGAGLVVRGQHIVQFAKNSVAAYNHRMKSLEITQGPWQSLAPTSKTLRQWEQREVSLIRGYLPDSIHILTLQKLTVKTVLLRLQHIFEVGEDSEHSTTKEVFISDMFDTEIKSISEVTLDGNSPIDCLSKRLMWRSADEPQMSANQSQRKSSYSVDLNPTDIRTFIIRFK